VNDAAGQVASPGEEIKNISVSTAAGTRCMAPQEFQPRHLVVGMGLGMAA
jgi:hypothetical protein